MCRISTAIALLVCSLVMSATVVARPGGAADTPVDDQGVVAAARFAVEARQKAIAALGSKDSIVLVKILAAQKQVVAGMNYHLTLQVKVGAKESTVKATVYERPWEKHIELTKWDEAK